MECCLQVVCVTVLIISGAAIDADEAAATPINVRASGGNGINLSGCPRLRSDCNFDCLAVGRDGCIMCTCSSSGGATLNSNGAHTTGSSAGSGASTINTNPSTPQLKGGNNSSITSQGSSVGGSLTSAVASQNLNGCPPFTKGCTADCLTLDSKGCPLCACPQTDKGGSSSSTGHHVIGGTSANANGCPAFRPNCLQTCVTLDGHGCPICSCDDKGKDGRPSTGNNTTISHGATSSTGHVTSSSGNNNGCPAFPTNCKAECVLLNSLGCPLCSCTGGGEGHVCPVLAAHCNIACLRTDDYGCVLCNGGCNEKYQKASGSSSTHNVTTITDTSTSPKSFGGSQLFTTTPSSSGSGGAVVHCEAFDALCNPKCIGLDNKGCLTCSCSSGAATSMKPTTTSAPSSASATGSGMEKTGNSNDCAQFDVSCSPDCVTLDTKGCLFCSCGQNKTPPPNGSVTLSPLLTGTTFAPIMPNSGSSGVNKTAGNGNGCPSFDKSCVQSCIKIDAIGCLRCDCPAQNGTATGSGSETGNGNGCPDFDLSCSPGCASIDTAGCLTCKCTGTTVSPGGTTSRGFGNANNCPRVHIFQCKPTCLKLDSIGCLSCDCKANGTLMKPTLAGTSLPTTVTTTVKTTTTTTANPEALKRTAKAETTKASATTTHKSVKAQCPKLEPGCTGECLGIDVNGCLVCTCAGTTKTLAILNTASPSLTTSQSTPGSNVCPPIRCVYPCDAGVTLGVDNCPICRCRNSTLRQ